MKVADLEKCLTMLLQVALDRGVDEIVLPKDDGYWTVTSPEWRDAYQVPEPALGSFADDEAELLTILAEPKRASAVDLERIAHMIRLLSDQIS